jgi:Tol biopolymer transport system component/Tfp pilus assembly protein PilF
MFILGLPFMLILVSCTSPSPPPTPNSEKSTPQVSEQKVAVEGNVKDSNIIQAGGDVTVYQQVDIPKLIEEMMQFSSRQEFEKLLREKYNLTYEQFENLLETFAHEATSAYDKGLSHLATGQYALAIQSFTTALQANPRHVDSFVYRGIAYSDNGEFNNALNDLSEAIRLDPNNARIYYNRGIVHLRNETYEQAISDFSKVLDLDPQPYFRFLVFVNRGHAFRHTLRLEDAIKDYSEAISLRPDMLGTYYNRGFTFFLKGEYDRALEDFNKAFGDPAIKNDPLANTFQSLAFKFMLTEGIESYTYEVEIRDIQKQLEEFPNADFLWALNGLMLEKAGRVEEALRAYGKALKLNPRNELAQIGYQKLSLVPSEKAPTALPKTVLTVTGKGQITKDCVSCTSPQWSPDGSAIVFVLDESDNRDILTINLNNGQLARLTTSVADDIAPSWSPDGEMIVYQSEHSGNSDIWVMRKDGSEKKQLTSSTSFEGNPVWSTKGWIAYVSDLRGSARYDIWMMNSDGENKKRLTSSRYTGDFDPAWDSDGKRLVFVSTKLVISPPTADSDIWVIDNEGQNIKQLTKDIYAENPTWSPDGKRIAFAAGEAEKRDIWVMDANGGNYLQLTVDPTDDTSPSWSPDGKSIVFESTASGTRDLWFLMLTETEQTP